MPKWATNLANLYWQLRMHRHLGQTPRRYWYRQIEKEKARLLETGLDGEEVRLFCRWLANPRNQAAKLRFEAYAAQIPLPF